MGVVPTMRGWFSPKRIAREYRAAWNTPGYFVSLMVSLVVLSGALYVNFWAIDRATAEAGPQVADLILSSFPAIEVDGFFVYGTFIVVGFAMLIILSQPRSIPFVLHGLTLFMVVRSGFTLLTHLGPPEAQYASDFGTTITGAFFWLRSIFLGAHRHAVLGSARVLAYSLDPEHLPSCRSVFCCHRSLGTHTLFD